MKVVSVLTTQHGHLMWHRTAGHTFATSAAAQGVSAAATSVLLNRLHTRSVVCSRYIEAQSWLSWHRPLHEHTSRPDFLCSCEDMDNSGTGHIQVKEYAMDRQNTISAVWRAGECSHADVHT